jgi:hypothetical protein
MPTFHLWPKTALLCLLKPSLLKISTAARNVLLHECFDLISAAATNNFFRPEKRRQGPSPQNFTSHPFYTSFLQTVAALFSRQNHIKFNIFIKKN